MRHLALLAAGVVMTVAPLCAAAPAAAETRVALVIGNSDYAELGRLKNPVNDMRLMAGTLHRLGFEVIERADADQTAMKRAIQDFGQRLEAAGRDTVGLFYYAGHGIQIEGTNYLIPLHAGISREPDVEIEAVKLDWVLAEMEHAGNRMNVLILDACRNNPLSRSFRSSEQGLSRIDAPRGTLIAYATAPGSVSFDGDGQNSPYTKALAATIQEPGLVVESAFRKVRVRVMEVTGNRQVSWESSSLTGAFAFNPTAGAETAGGAEAEVATTAAPGGAGTDATEPEPDHMGPAAGARFPEPAEEAELLFWKSIKDRDDPKLYHDYLARFPNGLFAPIAIERLDRFERATGASPEHPAGPVAAPPLATRTKEPKSQQAAIAPVVTAAHNWRAELLDYVGETPGPTADRLFELGQGAAQGGDLETALLAVEEAMKRGSGPALRAIGRWYDPAYYSAQSSPFSKPNPEQAALYYKRALDAGVSDAQADLRTLCANQDAAQPWVSQDCPRPPGQ